MGIPTVGLPMHNMRFFFHLYSAQFLPRIKCAFFNVGIPTVCFPMHNMRVFSTCIIRIFPTYEMRISYIDIHKVSLLMHLMILQTHVYYAHFFPRTKDAFPTFVSQRLFSRIIYCMCKPTSVTFNYSNVYNAHFLRSHSMCFLAQLFHTCVFPNG